MIGDKLGPYEITAKIGEGGMGEVYRASDARLGRDVAVKVLPQVFTQDSERLVRFEREAKILASLNHSNIAAIYGVEDAGGTRALVMELVEGETLAERLSRGPLPVEECLPVFLQIAEALEYAHEHGIVHRDLKPANIKISPDGKVKVLDFGLAKALDASAGAALHSSANSPTLMNSPTFTSAGTRLGMILGTAGYMSPEQAKGKSVDRRADIWSFGVMLWEGLTGTRLFEGQTAAETIASVLRSEPDLSRLPAATPGRVRWLVARCLRKDERARLQAIGEARVALEETLRGESDTAVPSAEAGQASSRFGWRPALALAAILVLGFGLGWFLRRPPPALAPETRWALAIPDGLKISNQEYPQLALSRDGALQVVVVENASGDSQLLLRRSDELEPRLLPDTERVAAPFFSPDGAWIGFFRDGALFKIPVAGGPPVRLTDTSGQPRGATWSRDGFIYFSPDTSVPLSRISENGSAVEPATHLDEARSERTHRWPEALPDGKAVLFTCDTQASTEFYDDARIEAVRLGTGERKVLVEGSSQARYLASGHLVFARAGSLFAVPFDVGALEVRGNPVPVAQGVATTAGSGAVQFAIAESGAMLWVPGGAAAALWLPVWVDRDGAETPTTVEPGVYNEIALSPDGKRLALVGGQGGGVSDLWVADLERGSLARLTFGEFVSSPTWTPDGTRLAYGTRLQGRPGATWQIALRPADGSRGAEILVEGERGHIPSSFSPDGRLLVYDRLDAKATQRDIWSIPLDGPREPHPLIEGPFMKSLAAISPDGRFIAYVSNESGRTGVYVRPFPSGEGRWQISAPLGFEPRWSSDGRQIFYRADGVLYRVAVDTSRGFAAGRPERLFEGMSFGTNPRTYSPAPDGQRFVVGQSRDTEPPARRVYFDLGFAASVERLAPTEGRR